MLRNPNRHTRHRRDTLLPIYDALNKTSNRLILGTPLVPIQIHNDILGNLSTGIGANTADELIGDDDSAEDTGRVAEVQVIETNAIPAAKSLVIGQPKEATHYVFSENITSHLQGFNRKGRVVGGEDGDNGEWCWQVALINSMNQYLCGAALIGTQWVLTAAHCVTKYVME